MNGHIFISYSKKDSSWLAQLAPILEQARIHFGVEYWTDARIVVSDDWNNEIEQALENSTAAIFLVSGDFLSSRFIKEIEIERLLKKSIRIFPLLVSDCLWRKIEWLAKIQIFPNSPILPLDEVPDSERKRLLLEFVECVIDKLKAIKPTASALGFSEHQIYKQCAPAPKTTTVDGPQMESCIVLNVDIRNFTLMQPETQHASIKALWASIKNQLGSDHNSEIIPHEDGAVFIFPLPKTTHQSVMSSTTALVKSLSLANMHLRAALHQGYVSRFQTEILKQPVTFGTAINECRKLCAFSDEGQFVVSETYLDGWENLSTANFDGLFPVRGRPPFKIMLKEDRYIGIRIAGNEKDKSPNRILFLNTVDEQIWLLLDDIESLFVDLLEESGLKGARKIAIPRISFLTPVKRHGMNFLTASSFRFRHGRRIIEPSNTYYNIEPPGSGCCGRAFVSGEIQVVAGLSNESRKYINYWKKRWNLDEEAVKGFSRASKAIMSIPIGIGDLPKIGVLCIDCMHPLTTLAKVNDSSLRSLCKELSDEFNVEFSALWALRMQH
jgi:hypothetical protein